MLTVSEIQKFIEEDRASDRKHLAQIGDRYYRGEHDIKDYRLYYFNYDGNLVEDKTRSNIKISHPFFTELVDQETQYMLSGGEGFIRSDNPELQQILNERFNDNEDFKAELYDTVTGAITKGWEYMYAYMNADGQLAFQCADSLGVVEVDGKYTSDKRDYVIYWYPERVDVSGKKVTRVQVWDDKQTYYYTQTGDEGLKLDESTAEHPNPRPHVLYRKDNDDNTYYEGLGFIPFFRLDNDRRRTSGVKVIKDIIDDYDLMNCGLSNNLQDASEYLVVVKGFQGDNLEELVRNIRTKKHIGVDGDGGGDVEYKTVSIPYEARQVKLGIDEANIYKFGMGFNSAQVGDGNITNVVIKARYTLLDLKCNKLEVRLRQFLRKIIGVALNEINRELGTDYQQKDVYFEFQREVITNAEDNSRIELTDAQRRQTEINTLLSLAQTFGNELVVQYICEVLDIDYEDIKSKLPRDELTDAEDDLDGAEIEE